MAWHKSYITVSKTKQFANIIYIAHKYKTKMKCVQYSPELQIAQTADSHKYM